jgi:hypothetical protein
VSCSAACSRDEAGGEGVRFEVVFTTAGGFKIFMLSCTLLTGQRGDGQKGAFRGKRGLHSWRPQHLELHDLSGDGRLRPGHTVQGVRRPPLHSARTLTADAPPWAFVPEAQNCPAEETGLLLAAQRRNMVHESKVSQQQEMSLATVASSCDHVSWRLTSCSVVAVVSRGTSVP